jgi:hypothetical protein
MNPRTVAKRSTTCARHSPSGPASAGGTNSRTASIAVRSRARDPTTASIASHTTPRGTASPHDSASNNTSTARDNTPAWRACPCARFSFALSAARDARPTRWLVMNASNSSNASSVAVTSSHRTVDSNVAILRW